MLTLFCGILSPTGNNKLYFLSIAIIIILISCLRYGVGFDFYSYVDAINYSSVSDRFELIPRIIIELARWTEITQIFFVISSIVMYGLIFYSFYRYSKFRLLSLVVFISYPLFFLISLGVVRQYLAVSFVIIGICLYINHNEKSKKFLGLFFVLTAILCHTSAMIMLPIIFISNRLDQTFKLVTKVTILLIVIFVATFSYEIIMYTYPYYAIYLQENDSSGYKILALTVLLYLISSMAAKRSKDKKIIIYDNLFFIGVCLYSALIDFGTAPARVAIFFLVFSCFSLPAIIDFYPKIKSILKIKFVIFFGMLYMSSLYFASINSERDPLLPYVYFFEVKS
ncbi:EpsG family protein [Vibrio cyclitrophicus]|nr:EpsG family protein [Vibrio cyclitrophicus]UPR47537.1 EpsG family protein [Vibrio cyclitrophicus]